MYCYSKALYKSAYYVLTSLAQSQHLGFLILYYFFLIQKDSQDLVVDTVTLPGHVM